MIQYILICAIIFFSIIIEAMTGFGSTVIAVPFLSMIISLKSSVAIMRVFSMLLGMVVVSMNFKHINFKVLAKVIVLVSIGMPLGIYAIEVFDEQFLKLCFGVFVTGYALISIFKIYSKSKKSEQELAMLEQKQLNKKNNPLFVPSVLFIGGIFQGAFATGGPFIVLYTSRQLKTKSEFRATMCCVWIILNSFVLIENLIAGGTYTFEVLNYMGVSAIFVVLGFAIGYQLHKKLSMEKFNILINFVILVSGLTAIIGGITG